jgi:hypothetical protein
MSITTEIAYEQVVKEIDEAIASHKEMVRKAKEAEPGWEESDFNRGYYAALVDIKRKVERML